MGLPCALTFVRISRVLKGGILPKRAEYLAVLAPLLLIMSCLMTVLVWCNAPPVIVSYCKNHCSKLGSRVKSGAQIVMISLTSSHIYCFAFHTGFTALRRWGVSCGTISFRCLCSLLLCRIHLVSGAVAIKMGLLHLLCCFQW